MPDTGDFGDGFDDTGFDDTGFGDSSGDGDGDEILRLLAPLLAPLISGQTPPAFRQPFAVAPNATPEQAIQSLLSLVAPQLRGRLGGLLTAIPALQAQANASPMALLGAAGPQVGQLSQQFAQALRALSQRLGPSGGGFLTQGRQRLGGQFATSLARLFAGIPGQAQGLLGKIAEGTNIAFPVPQTSITRGTGTQTAGFNLPSNDQLNNLLTGLVGKSRQEGIFSLFS